MQLNYRQNRSQSCPELTLLHSDTPLPSRKRALSENFFSDDKYTQDLEQRPLQLQSRHSETNLMRIDRNKTFNPNNIRDNTGEILAQVVFALNDFNSNIEEPIGGATAATAASPSFGGGVDLFSDDSILEDEWSIVTTPSDHANKKLPPQKFRSRAKSLYPQNSKISNEESNTPQFTWSGNNNDIQAYINAQVQKTSEMTSKKTSQKDTNGVFINIDKPKILDSSGERRKSIFTAFNNIFKRRNTIQPPNIEAPVDQIEQPTTPSVKISPALERKASAKLDTVKKPQFNGESKRRPSILSNQSASSEHVLENTTIADLIRAIEHAHTKNLLGIKSLDSRANRRMSMVPQMVRRGSVSFSTPLETSPSSATPNYVKPRRPSIAMGRNRILTMRQNSSPNRFNVTPVAVDSPSSAVSLSPIIQHRIRRFSAVPSTTIMPKIRPSSSLHATPLAIRRTQFKPTMSPLATMPPTLETPNNSKP